MIESEHTSLVQFLLNKEKDNKYCYSGNGGSNEGIGHLNKVLIKKIHHHELIFHENEDDNQHFCNACYYPIYPPFYTCPQSQCTDFYLHDCCANLPLHYHQPSMHYVFGGETCRDRPLELLPRFLDSFLHTFKCSGCKDACNGFVYGCKDCSVQLELSCAMLPEAITYQKHSNSHILLLSRGGLPDYLNMCYFCKGIIEQHQFYYECCSCPNFKLDYFCALLALTVSYKYDRHPLHLASPEFSTPKEGCNNKDDDVFCEICEEVMNDQQWFYQCKECVTSFHTRCIPFPSGNMNCKIGENVTLVCGAMIVLSLLLICFPTTATLVAFARKLFKVSKVMWTLNAPRVATGCIGTVPKSNGLAIEFI